MTCGDLIWVYLSVRQELCAVGTARQIVEDGPPHLALVDWDSERTATLAASPLPRSAFGQVPMSTCRARPEVSAILDRLHDDLALRAPMVGRRPRPTRLGETLPS